MVIGGAELFGGVCVQVVLCAAGREVSVVFVKVFWSVRCRWEFEFGVVGGCVCARGCERIVRMGSACSCRAWIVGVCSGLSGVLVGVVAVGLVLGVVRDGQMGRSNRRRADLLRGGGALCLPLRLPLFSRRRYTD